MCWSGSRFVPASLSCDDTVRQPLKFSGSIPAKLDMWRLLSQLSVPNVSAATTLSVGTNDEEIDSWFYDETHPFYLMHMPVPLDDDMLSRLCDPEKHVDGQVIKYILTYFTHLALKLKPSKRCAVVEPHFADEIIRDVESRAHLKQQPITTPRPFYGPVLTGCRQNFDYLLIPLYYNRHHTLAIWTRATGRVTYYNPMQDEGERSSPRQLFVAALSEIFAELELRGETVRT